MVTNGTSQDCGAGRKTKGKAAELILFDLGSLFLYIVKPQELLKAWIYHPVRFEFDERPSRYRR